jgi:hypothetical protein
MRKIVILGTLAALVGFAALAQASDHPRAEMRDGARVIPAPEDDHDTRIDALRERHDSSREARHATREARHEDDDKEHRDRR